MEVEIVSLEKDLCQVKTTNVTIAEILRVYLNEAGIKFAAWRKEHPTKPVVLRVEADKGTVKKAISDAVSSIQKDLKSLSSEMSN